MSTRSTEILHENLLISQTFYTHAEYFLDSRHDLIRSPYFSAISQGLTAFQSRYAGRAEELLTRHKTRHASRGPISKRSAEEVE